jgi:hypothetical protein
MMTKLRAAFELLRRAIGLGMAELSASKALRCGRAFLRLMSLFFADGTVVANRLYVAILMADFAGGALSFAVLCALTVETPLDLWFAAVIVGVADLLAVPPGIVLAILNSTKRNGKDGANLPDHRLDCLHFWIASMAEARLNSEIEVSNKPLQKKRKSE